MLDRSILEWLIAYRKLKVVAAACELRIFTHLAASPCTGKDLALLSRAKLTPLKALLDACVTLELLDYERGNYTNRAETEELLVEGKPKYLGDTILLFSSEAPQWEGLDGLLKTGETPPFEPPSVIDPQRFTRAMHGLGMLGEADALADAVPLENVRDLVDVGCGSGLYSVTLCRRYPRLHATLIDRAATLEVTRQFVDESDVADQITLKPGDFTHDSYGEERDVVLLSDVLYGSPSVCKRQLSSAFNALKKGGLLIIRGYFSDPNGARPPFGALFDVARLLWDSANEPLTIEQLRAWLAEVGFNSIKSSPLTERSSLLLATK